MGKSARPPPVDPLRQARYREIAREIVWQDRSKRKYGQKVDTAGAMVRALEGAFREGLKAANQPPGSVVPKAEADFVEWITIPPRPRKAFWSICMSLLSRPAHQQPRRLVPAATERFTPGWIVDTDLARPDSKPFADRSIVPLRRLGLLESIADGSGHLTVSERGKTTWLRNCDQSEGRLLAP